MAERYSGQQASITLVNNTTQDAVLASLALVSMTFTIDIELVSRDFIGETGTDYREFANGASIEAEIELTDAGQTLAFVNAVQARAKGLANDRFSVSSEFKSVDGGNFRLIFPDVRFEGLPIALGGRKDFAKLSIKGKCKTFKAQLS